MKMRRITIEATGCHDCPCRDRDEHYSYCNLTKDRVDNIEYGKFHEDCPMKTVEEEV